MMWSEHYERVCYDVEWLFKNMPVKETTSYILNKIYVDKSVKQSVKSLIIGKINKSICLFMEFPFNKTNW